MRHKLGEHKRKERLEFSMANLVALPILASRSRELKPVKFVYFQELDMEVEPPTEN